MRKKTRFESIFNLKKSFITIFLFAFIFLNNASAQNTWTARTPISTSYNAVAYANIAGTHRYVAVQNGGTQMYSNDGINWIATTTNNSYWTSVTYGNGLFVAVSYTGAGVMTSPDGITWTVQTSPASPFWESVTFGNGVFVAVATNRVMTSTNGTTWTVRTPASSNGWYGVTYGNGVFVAVSTNGTNRVMTSTDGVAWTSRTAAANNIWQKITYGNGLFVAVSSDGTNRVMTSTDGTTWASRSAAVANAWRAVAYGDCQFVALANTGTGNRVMSSPDGINWTARTSTADIDWKGIGYGNGRFIAVAYASGTMTSDLTAPEINTQGNSTNIVKGDMTTSLANHTGFGNVNIGNNLVRTYTIQNTGAATLNITSIVSSGANASKFVVGTTPTMITAGNSATFNVTYTPTTAMTDNATITINNNDCDEASYDFAVQGIGIISSPTSIFVSPTGSDSNDGLTVGTPKLTIANALSSINEGGTLNIAMGNYSEIVNVTKNVTFATTGAVFVGNILMNGGGKTLTLSNPLQVGIVNLVGGTIASNGNLIIPSNNMGTGLIDDFSPGYSGNITGDIQVQRYVSNANAGYRYFGSPVTGANSAQFGFNVFSYNESVLTTNMNLGWQAYSGVLSPLAGYNVFQTIAGNQTYTLIGTANTGVYNQNITRQSPNGTANGSAGFNALGNPYPSPISWTALLGLNAGVTTGTAWIFKTTELFKGQWASLNSSGVSTTGATNMIASSQGFLVRKATAGTSTFTINNSVRNNVLTNNSNYLRPQTFPLVRLQLSNNTFGDEAVAYSEEKATENFDMGLDTEKMTGETDKPYLAFADEQQDLSILATNSLKKGNSFSLVVRANGQFTLNLSEKTKINENLYLLDKKLNILHDLSKPYTFNANISEANRFVLVIGEQNEITAQNNNNEEVKIWSYEGNLFVNFAKNPTKTSLTSLILTDLQGRTILTNNNLLQNNTFKTNIVKGVYLVKVQYNNTSINKKVVLE